MSISPLRSAQFWFWKNLEGRAVFEYQSFYVLRRLLRRLPKGDGHPVIVFPGFIGSDLSTSPMRGLLKDLGYACHGWGLGRNLLVDSAREDQMRELLYKIFRSEGRRVSLVGWSLGGVFAREIAKIDPQYVRSVVTMGSPISGNSAHSNASDLYHALNGDPAAMRAQRHARLHQSPPLPTTSIYSKTDGIVAWEGSVQADAPLTENIVVPASHLGMGVNPLVMYALADRLAQAEDEWQPFERSGLRQWLFQDPRRDWLSSFGLAAG